MVEKLYFMYRLVGVTFLLGNWPVLKLLVGLLSVATWFCYEGLFFHIFKNPTLFKLHE